MKGIKNSWEIKMGLQKKKINRRVEQISWMGGSVGGRGGRDGKGHREKKKTYIQVAKRGLANNSKKFQRGTLEKMTRSE